MLQNLSAYKDLYKKEYQASDITMCFGLRLHAENPWILEHLARQFSLYEPKPRFVVADLGSQAPYAQKIKALAEAHGACYVYRDYQGVYSPAMSHNLAAKAVNTDFIFFNDPDVVLSPDAFGRLCRFLNNCEIGSHLDLLVNFSGVHLTEDLSRQFKNLSEQKDRIAFLDKMRFSYFYQKPGEDDFMVPYTNVFLCRKEGFILAGGYNEHFVGYGSEDFEFLLRFALVMGQYPMPVEADKDLYRPSMKNFYWHREYCGFRRLLETMSFTAEAHGFAAFHLWHPVNWQSDWHSTNDKRRKNFSAQVRPYLKDKKNLLSCDWLADGPKLLVAANKKLSADLLLPLRWVGFRLQEMKEKELLLFLGKAKSIEDKRQDIAGFVFGPGELSAGVEKIKSLKWPFIKIEKGLVPGAWLYQGDNWPSGSNNFLAGEISFLEKEAAKDYYLNCLQPQGAEKIIAALGLETFSVENENDLEKLAHLLFRRYSWAVTHRLGRKEGRELIYQFALAGKKMVQGSRGALAEPLAAHSYLVSRLGLMSKSHWFKFNRDGAIFINFFDDSWRSLRRQLEKLWRKFFRKKKVKK